MRKLKSCSLIQNHAQFVWEFDKFGGIYLALDNNFLWKVKDGSRYSGEGPDCPDRDYYLNYQI